MELNAKQIEDDQVLLNLMSDFNNPKDVNMVFSSAKEKGILKSFTFTTKTTTKQTNWLFFFIL